MKCHCDLDSEFEQCCGQYLSGEAVPATPEALMRSRYSAFVMTNRQYLLDTWHADFTPGQLQLDSAQRWLGLKVLDFGSSANSGWVKFVARYKINGKAHRLEEHSLFSCQDGRWYYLHAVDH